MAAVARRLISRGFPLSPRLCRLASGVIPGVPRALDDVVRLDHLRRLPPDQILQIWASHHADKRELAASALEEREFSLLRARGGESGSFIWPLKRGGGHMLLFSQFSSAHSMFAFTALEDYRRSPELAPPWLSVLLFDELLDDKGLALVRAEADADRLTKDEVENLLSLVRRFYGTDDYDKVWAFNHFQKRFDIDAYISSV